MSGDPGIPSVASLTVGGLVTTPAHCIAASESLEAAMIQMTDHGVRHMPVLDGSQLVGIVSERDVALTASLRPDRMGSTRVEDAMAGVPYCVDHATPLSRVANHMALRKLGSAIVTERGKIFGIFTTTDALDVLGTVLLQLEQAESAA